MMVKQISVFLENRPGKLAEFTNVLRQNGIDMRALAIADTPDFGILRMIVNDSYNTACVLKDAGYVFSVTPVLAVAISDEPGSLCRILEILNQHQINVEYTYAFITREKDLAYMIFRVEDNEKAIEVLSQNDIKLISQEKLSEI